MAKVFLMGAELFTVATETWITAVVILVLGNEYGFMSIKIPASDAPPKFTGSLGGMIRVSGDIIRTWKVENW